jgi:tRNA nucleotidyltransferase (CCA-adding enzyme)
VSPEIPEALHPILEALRDAGGRPFVVGGAVRDHVLGLSFKDVDIEVFGLGADEVRAALAPLAHVNLVGESFAVLKASRIEGFEGALDVSIPRRDSKVGPGHRGIAARGDPTLSVEEAARRRDFTMNAMLLDPFSGEILDPFGGARDLQAGVLRCVDPATFGEDPLRALRAAQFAARFELDVDAATAAACGAMPLAELPPERVFGEMEKLLLKARRPSIGFRLMRDWGMLGAIAPELSPLAGTPQDPSWHPEGDVWVHTLLCLDEAAALLGDLDKPRALTVMLATLCHDLGKPATTALEEGRIRSRGHEEAGVAPTLRLLDRWNVHTLSGYDVRGQTVALVAHHLKPSQLHAARDRVSDGAIRRLARKCEPELLYRVARADCLGRGRAFSPEAEEWFRDRVRELDVAERPPAPLLRGRDLLALGLSPGPRVGAILRAVYERQLDGAVGSREEALAEARRQIAVVEPA